MTDLSYFKDRFRGSLIGGALGDALGYEVEFMLWREIREAYGPDGIQSLALHQGKALISDDTQMTLFTAAGLICGHRRANGKGLGGRPEGYVNLAYRDWLSTQRNGPVRHRSFTGLDQEPVLQHPRAPGNTCLSALEAQLSNGPNFLCPNRWATMERPANNSKGCGGVMRAAPVGLLTRWRDDDTDRQSVPQLGARIAAITHGHPLGWLPAAALAEICHQICYPEECGSQGLTLDQAISRALAVVADEFQGTDYLDDITGLWEKAQYLATHDDGSDVDHIHALGGGWVGEEALAIALYACLRYPDNFPAAIRCAVNHSGDSDSTGSIAGNILGAWLGMERIREQLAKEPGLQPEALDAYEIILRVADEMAELQAK